MQKKVTCEKYKDKIVNNINEYNSQQQPEIRDSNNAGGEPIYNLYIERKDLKEIFYSPKVNSCLYLESRKTLVKRGIDSNAPGDWAIIYDTYYLIDALTSEEIDFNNDLPFMQVIHRGEQFSTQKDVENAVSAYK